MFNWDSDQPNSFLAVTALVTVETVVRFVACMRDGDSIHYLRSKAQVIDLIGVLFMWGAIYLNRKEDDYSNKACSVEHESRASNADHIEHAVDNLYGVLRAATVSRFIRSTQKLTMLVDTVNKTMPTVSHMCMVLFLAFYCFAILGMTVFQEPTMRQTTASGPALTPTPDMNADLDWG